MRLSKVVFLLPLLAFAVLALMVLKGSSGTSADGVAEVGAASVGMDLDELGTDVQEFSCPTDPRLLNFAAPVGSIHVTVRAGTWLKWLHVPAIPGSGVDSVFTGASQQLHGAPHLRLDSTSMRVRLDVGGSMSANQAKDATPQFSSTIELPRCTDDEGFLRRIHVDGPDRGRGFPGGGQPEIAVTGVYDRLLTPDAILDQAYECRVCDRVKVCGASPPECD